MSTIWQSVTWNVARAGGFTSYILLTLAIIVGLALSMKLQSPARWPRIINSELHNFLTLLSTIFLGVHVLAVLVDPYIKFSWADTLVPFVSQYRAPWLALGIVAMYVGIAIGISTWLRPHIGYKMWRKLHYLTFGIFVLATAHSIGTGSDTQTLWGFAIYAVSVVSVGVLLTWRIVLARKPKHAAPAVQATARKPLQAPMPARQQAAMPARVQPQPRRYEQIQTQERWQGEEALRGRR
jgi:predicted ferric reductase